MQQLMWKRYNGNNEAGVFVKDVARSKLLSKAALMRTACTDQNNSEISMRKINGREIIGSSFRKRKM